MREQHAKRARAGKAMEHKHSPIFDPHFFCPGLNLVNSKRGGISAWKIHIFE